MSKSINPSSINLEGLSRYLMNHNIPVETWGTGSAKTLDHLLNEIKGKECKLIEVDGELIRTIYVVSAEIYYMDTFGSFKLKEERQVFKGGRSRTRSLESSLSEKIKADEIPIDGIIRGTRFSCKLNRNQYKPNGYIEVQKDKTVYFVWEKTNKKGLE